MSDAQSIGPTTARNWGWVLVPGLVALGAGAAAVEATLRLGLGWQETALPLGIAVPAAAFALWAWRQPPFERTTLRLTETGLRVEGSRRAVALEWSEIAAVTLRPSSMGPAHMTLERAAEPSDDAVQSDADTWAVPAEPRERKGAEQQQPSARQYPSQAESPGDAPGVMFPVRAVGVRAEEIAAFLARGAAEAGYRLEEPMRGDGRAIYRFPGPRRWVVLRDGSP